MTAKSVLVRPQGLRPRARAPTCPRARAPTCPPCYATEQRCAETRVQNSTPEGVSVFQQDQERIIWIRVGVIFQHSGFKILIVIYTVRKL